jgi:hypothetical protein
MWALSGMQENSKLTESLQDLHMECHACLLMASSRRMSSSIELRVATDPIESEASTASNHALRTA